MYGDTPPEVGWTIGWKRVELLEENDWVLAKDERDPNGPLVPKRVEEKFHRWAFSAKLRAWGKEIGTTGEHPFYVVDQDHWTPANELRDGNRFLSHDGQQPEFEGFKQTDTYEELFNLRIADFHTYFVGGDDWGFSVWAYNSYAEPYYGSSDLSHEAQIERMLRPETYPGQNVAVFEYERELFAAASEPGGLHAEKVLFGQLENTFGSAFDPSKISRIYSEMEICNQGAGNCLAWLAERGVSMDVLNNHAFGWAWTVAGKEAHLNAITWWQIANKLA